VDAIRTAAGRTGIATVIEVAIPFTAAGPAPESGTGWWVHFAGHETASGTWLSTAPPSGTSTTPRSSWTSRSSCDSAGP
jgi:hypothetical protein